MKVCTKCKVSKEVTEFGKGRAKCKQCFKEYNLTYNEANRELNRSKSRAKYWENPEASREAERVRNEKDIRGKLISSARSRALKNGREFAITKEDINLVTHCPILGIELSVGRLGKQHNGSYTLDRLDNSKGYVVGNVHIISHRANTLKSDASLEELKAIINYIETN